MLFSLAILRPVVFKYYTGILVHRRTSLLQLGMCIFIYCQATSNLLAILLAIKYLLFMFKSAQYPANMFLCYISEKGTLKR